MSLLSDVLLRGDRASQPAAGDVAVGTLYFVTDEGVTEQSNGSTWDSYSGVGGAAPDTADYLVETAQAGLSAEVVTGTTYMTTAAYGSRQAAAKAGRLFLPNDGFYVERDTGAAWAPWGPLFPMTAPVDGSFSWINQGSATVTTTFGGVHLVGTAAAGPALHLRVLSAPSTPYTITGIFIPMLTFNNFSGCGLCWRQSSDGKIVIMSYDGDTNTITVSKWNSATSFSAAYSVTSAYRLSSSLMFFRIADDGANRICSLSQNGQIWNAIHTVGRTDFLTGDQVGFFVKDQNTTYAPAMTVLSWVQG